MISPLPQGVRSTGGRLLGMVPSIPDAANCKRMTQAKPIVIDIGEDGLPQDPGDEFSDLLSGPAATREPIPARIPRAEIPPFTPVGREGLTVMDVPEPGPTAEVQEKTSKPKDTASALSVSSKMTSSAAALLGGFSKKPASTAEATEPLSEKKVIRPGDSKSCIAPTSAMNSSAASSLGALFAKQSQPSAEEGMTTINEEQEAPVEEAKTTKTVTPKASGKAKSVVVQSSAPSLAYLFDGSRRMQPVRRRTKRNKSNPDLVKEKVALERVLGAPVVALEARLPQELKETSRGAGRTAVEQLREQLDTLSIGTRRPCPLDASKCLHQLQVDQDTLYFPFEPLAPQRAVCNHVIKACDRGGIALLQSPTGTGKSLALLCAALAWQRRVASMASSMEGSTGTGTVPQIVYGVRTHTQIKQIIVELKKSGYRPRMAVIGSREQLCANSAVQRHAKQQQVPLNFSCRQAARCAAAQLPGGCQLYTGMGNSRYAKRIFDRCGQAGRLWDVEDLIASSTAQDSVAGCPYYTAHILAGDADIVFCPHNYILDPSVSQCRSHHRERWSLKGRIVIIDEAHNLEQCCREAGSLELSISDLRLMSRNLRQMPLRHPKLRFSERRSCAEVAAELERLPLQLSAFLSSQRIPTDTTRETSGTPALASHVLWGLPKVQTTKVFLQQCSLTAA
eukprot:symbB.v1.2.002618.t1/scaffold139.1/size300179/1